MPLDVLETRTGEFYLSDTFRNEDRKRSFEIYQLLKYGPFVLVLPTIIVLFTGLDGIWKFTLVIFALILVGVNIKLLQIKQRDLDIDFAGIRIKFNDNKELTEFWIRNWLKHSFNDFSEEEVRFNQAIGFQAVITIEGDFLVEIMVDPNFPGTAIFKTYDLFCLAEFIILFQLALPSQDNWMYNDVVHGDWDPEQKKNLNKEIQSARVPWQIRHFLL